MQPDVLKENKRYHLGTMPMTHDGNSRNLFYFKNLKQINPFISMVVLLIIMCGLVNLASIDTSFFYKQLTFFVLSIPCAAVAVSINLRYVVKFAYILYLLSIAALAFVLVAGNATMGATRWIDVGFIKIQPSEIAKIAVILSLSRYFHFVKTRYTQSILSSIVPLIIILSLTGLVLKQPDLGSGAVILMIGVCMIFISGLRMTYFIIAGVAVLVAIPVIWGKMHDYQKQRILTFIDQDSDPRGTSYNIIQSKITIGSGGVFGKGFGNSSQAKLEFLPESHTDFAFTVFAEQFGFVGVMFLMILFMILVSYGYYAAYYAESHFCRLLSSGISTLIFLHVAINIAMVSGIVPVVGIPLPFISYGGTFLMINLCAFGLLLNLDINKEMVIQNSSETYAER